MFDRACRIRTDNGISHYKNIATSDRFDPYSDRGAYVINAVRAVGVSV